MRTDAPAIASDVHTVPEQRAEQDTTSPKAKDPFFSNAKLILIILVVCGHSWGGLFDDDPLTRSLYMTLYAFHMPAFILICGYFSKSFTSKPRQLKRLFTSIVAPYVIFSFLYGLLQIWVEDGFDPSLLYPYHQLWFLPALFVWRITAPIWYQVRFPVLIAIGISLGASVMELPAELDLGRILQYMPFFVAGMFLERKHLDWLKQVGPRVIGPLLSVGLVVAAYVYGSDIHITWIYFTDGGIQMDTGVGRTLAIKVALLLGSAILIATFFAWLPSRQFSVTKFGEMTMYPFLLHAFFTKSFTYLLNEYPMTWAHTGLGTTAIAIGGALLACVLLTPPVRWLTRPLVEPKLNWLFKQPVSAGK